MTSGGRERTKGGRGGLVEKGTHGAGLSEECLHCASNFSGMFCLGSVCSFNGEEEEENDVYEVGREKANVPRDLLRMGLAPFHR